MLDEPLAEATRQLTICNACRYCEAYCAVFPALEIRREVGAGDAVYLANLCHDCRACYYACMYAAPHEFAINIPEVLAAVRVETYGGYAWPPFMTRVLDRGAWRTAWLSLAAALLVVAGIVGLRRGHDLFAVVGGPRSFYQLVPYLALITIFGGLSLFALIVIAASACRFWREMGGRHSAALAVRAVRGATADALQLRYLRGGGDGCYYPQETPSGTRRAMHSLVFYGFLLDFGATVSAAILQDIIGVPPPYPLVSVPVMLGAAGGAMMVIGTTALIYIKHRSDPRPATAAMVVKDYGFLTSLDLVATTGFLLLALRDSPLLGTALAVHLGSLVVFFLTMPYGKFVHFAYRYMALVQNRLESGTERTGNH